MKIKLGYLSIILILTLFLVTSCQPQPKVEAKPLPPPAAPAENTAQISSGMVNYGNGFNGYFVKPTQQGTYPAVVMMHEWWGLNQNIKDMADNLAKEGYMVLAVDLYGGKVTSDSTEAAKYVGEVNDNPDKAIRNMKDAVSFLKNREEYSGSIASIGWCFGGGMSMKLSLNQKLDATVIYYGNLVTDEQRLKSITWPVLGVFGEKDTTIPVDSVHLFQQSLDDLGIQNEIYIYPGVGHAFANPSNPGHDAEKTADAWMKTVDFLDRNLK